MNTNYQEPLKLLLGEDSEDDIVILQKLLLETQQIRLVGIAQDGEEVMAFLRREGTYQEVMMPQLLLLDINMPKKNGFEVLQEIRSDPSLAGLPVVILSTSTRQSDIDQCYLAGANAYIVKPGEFLEFRRKVREFVEYWTNISSLPNITL